MFRKLEKTPWIIPITIMSILALVISAKLFIEDFWTSYNGYQALDTRKVTDVFGYVSLLPQVMPTLVGFYLVQNWNTLRTAWNQNPLPTFFRVALYGLLVLLFLGADVYSDVFYKSYEFDRNVPLAVAESIIVYTLGSEVLFSISAPLALTLFAPALSQIFILVVQGYWSLNGALKTIGETFASLEKKNDPNKDQNRDKNRNAPPQYSSKPAYQNQFSRNYPARPPSRDPNYTQAHVNQPTFPTNPPQRKP